MGSQRYKTSNNWAPPPVLSHGEAMAQLDPIFIGRNLVIFHVKFPGSGTPWKMVILTIVFFVCLPEGIPFSISNLVGGWATPLKNMSESQLGWWHSQYIYIIYGKIKFMFQTNKQLWKIDEWINLKCCIRPVGPCWPSWSLVNQPRPPRLGAKRQFESWWAVERISALAPPIPWIHFHPRSMGISGS